ncbi:MAG: hypothetical protein SPC28_00095 [Alloprevotella sp.]|nr:hypothetical protein [Alloprevotella sp.]
MYIPNVCLAFAHLLHKIGKLASLLLPLLIYAACGGGASVNPYSEAERKAIDSVLLSNRDCDTRGAERRRQSLYRKGDRCRPHRHKQRQGQD